MKRNFLPIWRMYLSMAVLLLGLNNSVQAQCTNTIWYTTMVLPTTIGGTATIGCQYPSEYSYTSTNTVVGYTYQFTSSITTDFITVRIGTYNGTVAVSGTSGITWTATSASVLYMHTNLSSACNGTTGCRDLTVTRIATPTNCAGTPNIGTITSSGGNSFCGSASPTLTLTGATAGTGISYQWESSPTGVTWSPVGTNSTTYTLPAITSSLLYRCRTTCSFSALSATAGPILINVAPNPVVGVTSPVNAICQGSSTTMTANGASSYTWSPGTGLSSTVGATVTANPTTTTTYTITGTLGSCSATATKVLTVGTPFTITPVTATPTSVCAGGNAVLNATVPSPIQTYCDPSHTQGTFDGDYISLVQIPTTTLNNATGGNPTAPYYQLWPTSGNTTATLNAGSTYTLNVQIGTFGNQGIAAFIDYNWNGILDNAGEKLGEFAGLGVGGTASFVFTVPASAYNGVHRLRVRDLYATTAIDPCMQGGYGEDEDYNITIANGAQFSTIAWTESLGGGTTLASTTTVPVNANNITVNKTYGLNVTKDGCTATGSVNVTANPIPTATMTLNTPTVCAGDQPSLTFTGTPNAQVVYNINGVNPQTVTIGSGGTLTTTAPVVTTGTTYSLVSATNTTTTCSGPVTGSVTVIVNPRPTGLMIGSSTVCRDQPATISFGTGSANFPIYVTYSDGTNTYNATASAPSQNISVPTTTAGVFSYQITALSDVNNCNGIPVTDFTGTAIVDVKALPTVTVTSAAAAICPGGNTNVTIAFTGDAPYTFTYYDGTGIASPAPELNPSFTFNVTPAAATTYYVQALLDGNNCAAEPAGLTSTATVSILPITAITTQPTGVTACSERDAVITMAATGDNLTYVWYENGVAVSGPNYTPVNNTLTINNVTGLNGNAYNVIVNGTCGTAQTSANAILTEQFGNTWGGATSTDWSVATNWSCGAVPIITTNVDIPTSTTSGNMPLVNIPGALCNDITLLGNGATLGFDNIGSQLAIHGDLTNLGGTFNGSNGTIDMAGTTQSITGALTFDNLEINGGGNKTLNGDVVVEGILSLMNGTVELGGSDLSLEMPWAQMGGSATSFIITNDTGTVTGIGMGAVGGNPDAVTFHVGISGTSYTPIMMENLGAADDFSVRVMPNVYVDGDGTNPDEVTNPVVDRTWMVSEATAGGSIAHLSPYWNTIDETNGFDATHAYVAHYMGGEWTSDIDSAIDAPAATAAGSLWTVTEDSITSFSPFAVASYGQFPLGIRLSSITATNVGTRNKVEWKSAAEDAGDVYELESSVDAKSFKKIATVAANGKPSSYLQWDENPAQGVSYYRVKLIDAAGKFSYSKVVTATVNGVTNFTIEAYPNPVRSTVSVKVSGVVTGKGSVVVTDVTGKVVTTSAVVENNGAELNVSHLANGMYLLNYTDDVRNESIKINKQ